MKNILQDNNEEEPEVEMDLVKDESDNEPEDESDYELVDRPAESEMDMKDEEDLKNANVGWFRRRRWHHRRGY